MRKEIKRSLLLWPLVASASITAASLMQVALPSLKCQVSQVMAKTGSVINSQTLGQDLSNAFSQWQSDGGSVMASIWDRQDRRKVADADTGPIEFHASSVAGYSHSSAASVKNGTSANSHARLLAPVRNESHELAGMPRDRRSVSVAIAAKPNASVGMTDADSIISLDQLLANLWTADTIDLSGKTPRGRHFAGSSPIGAGAIATLGSLASPNDSADGVPNHVASLRRTDNETIVDSGVLELLPAKSSLPESTRVLGKPSSSLVADDSEATKKSVSKPNRDWPAGWPATPRLDEQIQSLNDLIAESGNAEIASWIEGIAAQLSSLRSLNRLGADESGVAIETLAELASQGIATAESVQDRDVQVSMLQVAHAINRRVAVWNPVWQNTRDAKPTWMVGDIGSTDAAARLDKVNDALAIVMAELSETGDLQGWSDFLLIDEVVAAASPTTGSPESRSIIAQRLLSRLDWHALEGEHLRWLRRDSVMNLAAAIRPWTHAVVDYSELLRQIERQESDAIDLAAIDIASAVQALRYSENAEASAVAKSLDVYYRNANVRFALTNAMLNRMLPSVSPKTVPVKTTVMGTRVRGISHINTDLNVMLKPAADRWALQFQTLGNVQTRSTGLNGPVAVQTTGQNQFSATAPIEVTRDGVDLGDVQVDVRGRTKLMGVRSKYDGWPLVGALVRSFASSKFDSMKPVSDRIASDKIRGQVASEMDQKLDEQIESATDQLSKMVLGPLGKMKLDPQVVDMATTDSRLLARYRLAGDWQLAAFTPRPRAPRTSLMSVQAHQSAVNNTLEQLVPRDEPMAIDEVITRAASMFGQSIEIPEDVPGNVTIQFARTRPITVEIEENRLWITLRVVKLSRDDSAALTNFIVRAAYRPEASGLQASLVREGHLRISGPGMSMRERLPARAVFNKVLSPNRKLPMTMPSLVDHPAMQGLAISQFELRDGWIGIAVSEDNAPRIALKP
ncbi:hypothetical protein [Rubripirellula obstinata]|nr:hypothetical protein [Rubripirellula obstinata]